MDGYRLERPHLPYHPFFRASKARHSGSNRPHAGNLIEVARCAGRVRHRTFASQLVQAPAFAVALIAERRSESSSIKVRAPRTVLVDHTVVSELRAPVLIQFRQPPHRDVLEHDRKQVVWIWRTSWKINDRFARDDRIDANGSRRIGIGRWHSSPRRA